MRPTTAAVLLLVGLNLMFTPLDPLLSNAAPGAAFNISLAAPVSLDDVQHLLALVPADAIVLASYDLFPLVANDVNAYTMFWTQNPNLELPFNLSHPPEFVVVSENRLYTVPPWLTDTLYVSSVFGVRAVAWTSPVGPVVLFEHGFAGAPISWGSGPTFPRQLVPRDLALTSSVKLVPNASAPGGSIALSVDGATGELLQTYGLDFGNGTYRVTFWVLALRWDRSVSVDPREMVFAGDGVPFAQPSAFRLSADYATLNGSVYVPVTANFTVTEPIFDLAIQAFSADPNIGLKIQAIDVERLA